MTLVGRQIGNIQIVERLGEGGMGEVYLGTDEVLGRRVAVKAIRTAMRPSAGAKRRFVREARLLSQLDHPNICRIYEFIDADEIDFIVLELVDGTTLSSAIRRGLSRAEKMAVAQQVAAALVAARSMSVIHRDLKPDNIMVGSDGVVKVLDFGLARSLPSADAEMETSGSHRFESDDLIGEIDETSVTELGHAVGTPMYMSPEQARGQQLTAASDVYSFGLVLQEVFSTTPPYADGTEHKDILAKAVWGDTQPVELADSELKRLIEEMKSLLPMERPSVEAVAETLRRIVERPKRRKRRLAAAAVATLLAAAAVVSTLGFVHARRSQGVAESATAQAQAVNAFLENMLESASPTAAGIEVRVVDVLDEAAWNVELEFADRPLDQAAVLNTLGSTYLALGRFDEAHKHLSTALELRRTELGDAHADTLASRTGVGHSLHLKGEIESGEAILRETLEACRRFLGPDHPQTLAAMVEFASTLSDRGAYDEAEALALAVVDGRRRTLGVEAPLTLAALEDLAVMVRRQGRYDEAEALHREILAAKERVLGGSHPLTANSLNNLASVLFRKQDYAAAEQLYRRVLDLRRERYGPDHPSILRSLGNIAIAVSRQGRYDEAEAISREQIATMRRVLGDDHPDTLTGENNLANTYRRSKKSDQAETIYRSVLERQRRIFGDEHPHTVRTLSNLAKTVQNLGRFEESLELNGQVVEIRRRTLGDEHPFTLGNIHNLGVSLLQLGRWSEAEPLLQEVFQASQRTLGDRDSLTAMAADGWAAAMAGQGRLDEALAFLGERLEIRRNVFGLDHPLTVDGERYLAQFLRADGQIEAAERIEQALPPSG